MEFQTLLETRRSIRNYEEGRAVSEEMIQTLIQAALEAPTWKNTETGRYYAVVSPEMKEKFLDTCLPESNIQRAKNASALIVTTFIKNWAGFNREKVADNELGNGWGCYDLGLQNENLVLKATELGLSTLIMGIRYEDKIRELLAIPEAETIVSVIAVGYAAESPERPRRRAVEDVLKFV